MNKYGLVKLYQVPTTDTYLLSPLGTCFSFYPRYKGCCDDGTDYIIPEGYIVQDGDDKQMRFYDSNDRRCDLTSCYESPAIVTDAGYLVLQKH